MALFRLMVNGRSYEIDNDGRMPLLWALRDVLGLTGTKYGCGEGSCGACTVLHGDDPIRSCQVPLAAMNGKSITTIENDSDETLHRCRRAWLEEDVSQCGYCQAGVLLETRALLARTENPTDGDVNAALESHICRCGSYPRIRAAIKLVTERREG